MNNNETIYHLLKWTNYNEGCQYFFFFHISGKKKSHSRNATKMKKYLLCIGIFQLCTAELRLQFKNLLKHYLS